MNSKIQEILSRNKAIASAHKPYPTFAEMNEMGQDMPHTIIVTCADPRCIPEHYLNLQPSDGVIILRNVGGHVTHALNDILALDSFLTIHDILVVHHTDCGTLAFKDAGIREILKERLPGRKEIDSMSFGAIDDLEQSVRDDLAILRTSPYVRKELADHSIGFIYDLKTGWLSAVEA